VFVSVSFELMLTYLCFVFCFVLLGRQWCCCEWKVEKRMV